MDAQWRDDGNGGAYMLIAGGITIEVKRRKDGSFNPHLCGISHPYDFPTLNEAKGEGLKGMREHLQFALARIAD